MFQVAKVLRIFSSIFFVIILLFIYAYLPLTIDINFESIGRIGRNFFFYSAMGSYVVLHLMFYFFRFYVDRAGVGQYLRLVVHLLPTIMLFSLTLLIGYVGVLNNADDIAPSRYYYLNYLSAALMIGWFFAFLFVLIRRK
jgi:hypothetical protein